MGTFNDELKAILDKRKELHNILIKKKEEYTAALDQCEKAEEALANLLKV